ncbi:MAG: hypothetical protein GX323_00585 [Clostridiales bacterium]|nr:hypothetical protein [Clostridiales bacterium]
MFLIGETTEKVKNGKVSLPKEYHLRRYTIYGKWKGKNTLFLSDSKKALNFAAGRDTLSFLVKVDSDDRIEVPKEYEDCRVDIKGRISTVELTFKLD